MKQYDYKMELYDSIWKLALAMKLPKFEKATVKISYYHATKRRRDPSDNYAPKFLMDALVKGGVLTDDNGELVKVIPVGMEYDPERPRTEIYIYRME
jgi:Holliday junction resolvase RusA-like endonuclease